MKKVLTALSAAAMCMSLAACSSNSAASSSAVDSAVDSNVKVGTATGLGFAPHGDIVTATVELTDDKITSLSIDEYYGIRSIGHIINNLEKASDDEKAFVDTIADEDKVYSADGKYVNWKYVMIDGKVFECEDAGENLYKEIGKDASIEDLKAYAEENTDWWVEAMKNAKDTGAILKVAADGDEVVAEAGDVKLAKQDELKSFYGGLTKSTGYTKNFNKASGTPEDWENSIEKLTAYILNDGEISAELDEAAHEETTDKYLDLVTGATFGYPSIYVDITKKAIENAQ